MIHLGDITKIKGNESPTVDCIIGGSPCQDLSLAGKRAGLAGARSGLYMEQIRIIKEMREYDRANGRTGVDVRPRYMVWENVPGAFSTNGGEDFAAVLEEAIRVAEPKAPNVSVPEKGWPTAGCIVGEQWSVAWRVLDAQFWGTSDKPLPQRRRRIALVADFGGLSAPEILFVRKSVSGDIEPGKPKGKETSGDAEGVFGGAGKSVGFPLGFRPENVRCYDEMATTLCNGTRPGFTTGVIQERRVISVDQGGGKSGANSYEDVSPTLTCTHDGAPAVAYGVTTKGNGDAFISEERHTSLTAGGGQAGQGYPCVMETYQKVTGPIMANSHPGSYTGQDAFSDMLVAGSVEVPRVSHTLKVKHIVRRLTPLECERLQGFPDGWTLIGVPVEEDVPDYVSVYDESKYVAPRLEDFGLTEDDLNDYSQIDEEYIDDGNYFAYKKACNAAWSKARKKVKVGSHKEINYYYTDINGKRKKVSDSARYKALGNSIALPPWKWVLKRLCACYERDATMASLFDGIGGFPLIWEQINGKGSCLWASEIEEFPMAVTKERFCK